MSRVLKRPIIIIFTGHVGSSWFTSLLGNHKSITQLGFEPIDDFVVDNINAAPIIEDILRGKPVSQFSDPVRSILSKTYESEAEDEIYQAINERNLLETQFIVIKTRIYLEKQRRLFIDLLPRANPTIIFLSRRNKIKNAISQFKRTQLKISHLGSFHEIDSKREPIKVNPTYILEQATNFVRRELLTRSYFNCLKQYTTSANYEIFYEDLLSVDWRNRFFDDFFQELGLENNPIESNYLKMTPDNIQDAVINFTELSALLNGTAFQPSIEDDNFNIVDDIYKQRMKFPGIDAAAIFNNVQSMFRSPDNV
jgi:hypothetical protein